MLAGLLMIPGALSLRGQYERLTLPVAIIAGEGDKAVFKRRSEQLRSTIESSTLEVVPGGWHMVHHQTPEQVVRAVAAVFQSSTRLGTAR